MFLLPLYSSVTWAIPLHTIHVLVFPHPEWSGLCNLGLLVEVSVGLMLGTDKGIVLMYSPLAMTMQAVRNDRTKILP